VKRIALLFVVAGTPMFIFAQSSTSTTTGITPGAVVGLLATWIGVLMGYLNLRRQMRAEMMEAIRNEAHRIASEMFSARAATLMDRREQETINKHNEERLRDQASMRDLAREIRYLAESIGKAAELKRS
jgi:hypothetical protein